jgi:hypothetical protein
VKPPYYRNVFVAKFLGSSGTRVTNVDLSSDYNSVYTVYEHGRLAKLVIIDFHEYNPGNSLTRPNSTFEVASNSFESATLEYLTAPGATFNTSITIGDVSYDYNLAKGRGVKVGNTTEIVKPVDGVFKIPLSYSEAVIVTFSEH